VHQIMLTPVADAHGRRREVAPATLRRVHATHPITALQTEYSLWSRDPEDAILAARRNVNA